MDLRRKLFGAAHPQFAVALIGHGSVLNAMNRMGEALTLFDQAIALRTAQGLTQDYLAAVAQRNRARALLGLGRPADALQAIDLAQPIYERLAGDDLRVKFELAAFRALALAGLGQRDPARAAARSALAMTVAAKTLGRREWDALRAAAR
jgi:tetratricopeptide (TPR) repeat protein